MLSAGVLAHKGLLPFWGVAACAAIGSALTDQLWFLAGRLARGRAWVQRVRGKPAYQRALRLLQRHPVGFLFSFRFVYGLRTISPVVIGTSDLPAWQFVALNGLAAAVWGPLLTWLGYQFGKALAPLLASTRTIGFAVIAGALLTGCGYVVARRFMANRRNVV